MSNVSTQISLLNIKKGHTAVVTNLNCNGITKQRLTDLGIKNGAKVFIKRVAPLGDPIIVDVNDCEIAIRKSDAKGIVVIGG